MFVVIAAVLPLLAVLTTFDLLPALIAVTH